MARIDNRRDLLLLLLYSPGRGGEPNEPVEGRTRLVKMLFLFREEALHDFRRGTEITAENFYEFFPWDFGPFSREVYDDLTFFQLRGFVASEDAPTETLPESAAEWAMWQQSLSADDSDLEVSEYSEEVFSLTSKGAGFAEGLYSSLSPEQRRLLKEFKARTARVPLRALLEYVYKNYENQTTRSRIKPRILGR